MDRLKDMPAWQQLEAHYRTLKQQSLRSLFEGAEAARSEQFVFEVAGLRTDFSKNAITEETLACFTSLLQARQLNTAIDALFSGAHVNSTEHRAAWHTVLRHPDQYTESLRAATNHWRAWVEAIRQAPYTDIVHVGMGGSYLGPALLYDAFSASREPMMRCHFIANQNEAALRKYCAGLNPKTTLLVLASKSFTTAETMVHAEVLMEWMRGSGSDWKTRVFAVTAATERAQSFGVLSNQVLPLWGWLGGRYSVWSAVSFSVAVAFGWDCFLNFVSGAQAMDVHFQTQPWERNIPVILACLGVGYRNFFKAQTQAIIPYHAALNRLPAYMQQLHMESLGKSVTRDGWAVDYETGAIIWGGIGPGSQHSFHQLLLQGTVYTPVDFIVTAEERRPYVNCMAQSIALMEGQASIDSYREIRGNQPSTLLTLDNITPFSIGALLAMYEHKVYVQSVIWDINAFDQWGVECGKRIANDLLNAPIEDR